MPQDQRARIEQAQLDLNRRMVKWTRIVGLFTIILALVSIVTAGFVLWQSLTAASVAKDTREQLRALLQLASVQSIFGPGPEGKQVYGFSSVFQNLGSTRTGPTKAWHSIAYYDRAVPNNADFSKPRDVVENLVGGYVGGNASIAITPVAISLDDVERVLRKEGVIVMWGNATYSDIFDAKVEHSTSFCQTLTPVKDAAGLIAFAVTPFRSNCNNSL